jgi:hypothetical protein
MQTLKAGRPEPKAEEEDEEVYEYKRFNWRSFFLKPKHIRGFICLLRDDSGLTKSSLACPRTYHSSPCSLDCNISRSARRGN